MLQQNIGSTAETAPDLLLPPLRVIERAVYRGPHLYSHTPMIRIQLELGALEDYPTDKLPGFSERLLATLPGLKDHGCSSGHKGGFVERLATGTWMGHVVEHVALELQCMAGDAVTRGKTRSVKGERGAYNVMFAYRDEEVGLLAGRIALDLVASVLEQPLNHFLNLGTVWPLSEEVFSMEAATRTINRLARSRRLGPSTAAIVTEAERRGISWERMDQHSLIRLGTGRHQKRVRASIAGTTSQIAVDTASNKDLTKRILSEIGVPVPRGEIVRSIGEALRVARALRWPVVVKPLDANHGRGVTTDVQSDEALLSAFERAKELGRRVIVEQYLTGRDYRVLVVGGRVIAAAERTPASVIGDGSHTVEELVARSNMDPRRGEGHESVMTKITLDEALDALLTTLGMTRRSVPQSGREVVLRHTANLSSGGTATDCTDVIHADNAAAAVRAAEAIGLDVAGIDFILPDIQRSWHESGGGIVEVNAAPGLRMHLAPSEGVPRPVAKPIVDLLFPEAKRSSIPIAAITGTNGKSTTARMVMAILRRRHRNVGLTSTTGIYRNDEMLWKGDASGPKSARMLLRDPTIDAVVLETARGGILREGLAFDRCDVGAVLNVSEDHLGVGGINRIEQLAQVKSVVTEAVSRNGVSVLNADDDRTRGMARHAGGRVCFFSMKGIGAVQGHVGNGGLAVIYDERHQQISIHDGQDWIPVIRVQQIPATLGGAARLNIENALAATSIGYGMGAHVDEIKAGLAGFHSSYEHNPGRLNVFDGHGFRVVMDYAHNPAALRAFLDVIDAMRDRYNRVIGSISTPGDRRTADIKRMGSLSAHEFDLLVFRELPDNRGRAPNEVTDLLRQGALEAGADARNIVCVRPEKEATEICLRSAEPGDLVVLMPTDIDACWKQIIAFKPAVRAEAAKSAERHASL